MSDYTTRSIRNEEPPKNNNIIVAFMVVLIAVAFAFSIYVQSLTLGRVQGFQELIDQTVSNQSLILSRQQCIAQLLTFPVDERLEALVATDTGNICDGVFLRGSQEGTPPLETNQ